MTHAKPANSAKAGSATGFPACALSATDANPWAMRMIRTAAHRRKALRHKAFRGIRTIRIRLTKKYTFSTRHGSIK
jgi:hypothetical protein